MVSFKNTCSLINLIFVIFLLFFCMIPLNATSVDTSYKPWTILLYNDADFIQGGPGPHYIFAEEVYSNQNMNVIILQDPETGPATVWYVDENHEFVPLEYWGEINMGDPITLQTFIEYGKQEYPADRYFLFMYNHGSGWKGACRDDTNNDQLSMDEMQQALFAAGGVTVTCFSAPCLMGAMESAYELRECTELYIGSQETSGYLWWIGTMENITHLLYSNPAVDLSTLGKNIIHYMKLNI